MNLPSCQLFEGFSKGHCECFFDLIEEMTCKQCEWLFREGDPAEQLYFIRQGAVELLTYIDDQVELPITILRSEIQNWVTSLCRIWQRPIWIVSKKPVRKSRFILNL